MYWEKIENKEDKLIKKGRYMMKNDDENKQRVIYPKTPWKQVAFNKFNQE